MKRNYEIISGVGVVRNGGYYPFVSVIKEESQFLDSKPQPEVSTGFIPMTGKGIDAEVDDLVFLNENYTDKEEKNPQLIYKLKNRFRK